jgi:hypothetical protein
MHSMPNFFYSLFVANTELSSLLPMSSLNREKELSKAYRVPVGDELALGAATEPLRWGISPVVGVVAQPPRV